MLEVFFRLSMVVKESADLILIILEDLAALVIESLLNVVELVTVVCSHLIELELHRGNKEIDVVILIL
jgi:hypothetical protein